MKHTKKLLAILLILCMVFTLTCTALAEDGKDMAGKIVILHSNDVHGAVDGYAKIAGLRDEYAAKGAEVILADAGDFSQGDPYVSVSKGATAIQLMNAAGYDVATLGNHEFDFGYDQLMANLKDAKFKVLCSDVMKDGKAILDGCAILEKGGVKIGFFGLETPETYTKVNPGLIQGVTFTQGDELYANAQTQIDKLKADGADIIVCLSHLGVDAESEPNRSVDVFAKTTGIDIMLDGHSHTVMTEGENKEPIQSTGTKFANVGVVVIDGSTKKIVENKLVPAADIKDNEAVLAEAKKIKAEVDEQYGAVFAKSEVELNGDKAPGNRNVETNLGDLITDSMLWSVLNAGSIDVPDENVVAITNGGGIRAWIHKGDVTMKDVNTVLPFGNTIAVVYVKGSELLEALEASAQAVPGALGGFPQVAGMKITIDSYKEYDKGDQYPSSTYFGPKSIQRVTINEINGKAFDENATYAVVTNNFCAAGGDTYYAFKAASAQFDTSIPMDEALMQYIKEELKGVIGEAYDMPQGRITVLHDHDIKAIDKVAPTCEKDGAEAHWKCSVCGEVYSDAAGEHVMKHPVAIAAIGHDWDEGKVTKEPTTYAEGEKTFTCKNDPEHIKTEAIAKLEKCPGEDKCPSAKLVDVDRSKDSWSHLPIDWAFATGVTDGKDDTHFGPNDGCTRAQAVTFLWRAEGRPDPTIEKCGFVDVPDDAYYQKAVLWAFENHITDGVDDTHFNPNDTCSRAHIVTFLCRVMKGEAGAKNPFEDVPAEKWFTDAVLWAFENNVTDGIDDTHFGPGNDCTRAQIVTFIYRAKV